MLVETKGCATASAYMREWGGGTRHDNNGVWATRTGLPSRSSLSSSCRWSTCHRAPAPAALLLTAPLPAPSSSPGAVVLRAGTCTRHRQWALFAGGARGRCALPVKFGRGRGVRGCGVVAIVDAPGGHGCPVVMYRAGVGIGWVRTELMRTCRVGVDLTRDGVLRPTLLRVRTAAGMGGPGCCAGVYTGWWRFWFACARCGCISTALGRWGGSAGMRGTGMRGVGRAVSTPVVGVFAGVGCAGAVAVAARRWRWRLKSVG